MRSLRAKKWRQKSPVVYQKDPALLIALLSLSDKKTQTCEEQHHETDRHYPCDNHIVENMTASCSCLFVI